MNRFRTLWLLPMLLVVLLVFAIVWALASPNYYTGGPYYGMMGFGFGFGMIMMIFWVIIGLVLLFVFLDLLEPRHHDDSAHASEILDERYARGEISREEYLKRKEDLRR